MSTGFYNHVRSITNGYIVGGGKDNPGRSVFCSDAEAVAVEMTKRVLEYEENKGDK